MCAANVCDISSLTMHKNFHETYIVPLVRFSSFDNDSVKNNVLCLEIVEDLFSVDFVDGFINNSKTLVVSFGVNTCCF